MSKAPNKGPEGERAEEYDLPLQLLMDLNVFDAEKVDADISRMRKDGLSWKEITVFFERMLLDYQAEQAEKKKRDEIAAAKADKLAAEKILRRKQKNVAARRPK